MTLQPFHVHGQQGVHQAPVHLLQVLRQGDDHCSMGTATPGKKMKSSHLCHEQDLLPGCMTVAVPSAAQIFDSRSSATHFHVQQELNQALEQVLQVLG